MKKIYSPSRIVLLILLILLLLFQIVLPRYEWFMDWYITSFFGPVQYFKTSLFASNLISVGDIVYAVVGVTLIYQIIRFIYAFYTHKLNSYRVKYRARFIAFLILGFLLSMSFLWNINYKREKVISQFAEEQKTLTLGEAIEFQKNLIAKMNSLDTQFVVNNDISAINLIAEQEYKNMINESIPSVNVVPSIFGNILQNIGVQGYYNPITSEAQINKNIPSILRPFVVVHEMSHQLGIANEGDANLVSYIICTNSDNKYFEYSGYFNIFLYNHRLIMKKDKAEAERLLKTFHSFGQRKLSEVFKFRAEHKNWVSKVTLPIYEVFLRMNGEVGLGAYTNVAKYAMQYEANKNKKSHLSIRPFN